MIKIFRRVRQNLILENKTSKYFKYAIGEIILVVIGILIALSINNWNEKRKTHNQLQGYLNGISKNIQSDTIEINIIKALRERQNLAAKDYVKYTYMDSMPIQLVPKIAPILGEQYLNVNQSGFDALKNSGYIANLQGTALEDAIYDYYSYYEEIHESETSLNNFIENMEAGLYDGEYEDVVIVYKVFASLKSPNEFSKKDLQKALKQLYNNSKMLGIMQRVASEEYFFVYDSLKTKGQKIVTLIKKEFDND
ncbi:DUF6090 family protein [Pontimicrobium aquaticum]|uniref:Uncharacterized protein n=1 Tax=Pontimicrobium aquaticum TaxID=2565367 RepID=A0A4U0EX46_9FLAO|nr:DUF6090 family protein [Pontimicrobium aquaticum]TJY36440.1 hypothetical protein E5167_07195 [Pontimicrobium aquaticum]